MDLTANIIKIYILYTYILVFETLFYNVLHCIHSVIVVNTNLILQSHESHWDEKVTIISKNPHTYNSFAIIVKLLMQLLLYIY